MREVRLSGGHSPFPPHAPHRATRRTSTGQLGWIFHISVSDLFLPHLIFCLHSGWSTNVPAGHPHKLLAGWHEPFCEASWTSVQNSYTNGALENLLWRAGSSTWEPVLQFSFLHLRSFCSFQTNCSEPAAYFPPLSSFRYCSEKLLQKCNILLHSNASRTAAMHPAHGDAGCNVHLH